RDPVMQRTNASERRDKAGPKEDCTGFDDRVQKKALQWLRSDEPNETDDWLLWVSFIKPHFPHYAPPEFYNLYDPDEVELPPADPEYIENLNRLNKDLRYHFEVEQMVDEETWIRNVIGYHALISYIDHQIGELMDTLNEQGLAEDTLVIFCSDHGEMLGQHGMWWKCAPYEPSVRTPMIMAGPGVEEGRRVTKPVSNVDMFPTLVDAFDRELSEPDADLPGESLLPVARGEDTHRDFILTQYHGHGVSSGWFALRSGDYKYIHYHNNGHELYNLADDPYEMNDLSADPAQSERIEQFDTLLHDLVDPEQVDANAKADQAVRLEWIKKNMPEEDYRAKIGTEKITEDAAGPGKS
ncbi:MAG: sulfatase-like hydrolase/transferase, partial [Armatimonadota bacterium]